MMNDWKPYENIIIIIIMIIIGSAQQHRAQICLIDKEEWKKKMNFFSTL